MALTLNTCIKQMGLAATGGQAKLLIRSGAVRVNGQVVTANKKKVLPGDVITCNNKTYIIPPHHPL